MEEEKEKESKERDIRKQKGQTTSPTLGSNFEVWLQPLHVNPIATNEHKSRHIMEEQRTKKKANCKQTQETERNIAHIIFFHCRDILNLSSQWVREKNARIGTEVHLRDHEQGHSHDRFDS